MAARSEASGGGLKSAGWLRVVGVVVLVAAALGSGAVRMGFLHLPGSQEDDVLAKGETTTQAKPAKGGTTAGEALNLDAPAAEPSATFAPTSTTTPDAATQ